MAEPLEDAGAAKGAAHFSFGYLFLGPPDLGKIEDLVRCCERRKARAADKLASAQTESADAEAAYQLALAAAPTGSRTGRTPNSSCCERHPDGTINR
jgi:hypothetical protein